MNKRENRHVKNFIKQKMKSSERVEAHLDGWIGEMMGTGKKKQRYCQLILTNDRVCFYRKGFLGEIFETIPLAKITSVETLSFMGYRVFRIHTSHDELAFKTFESKALFDEAYQLLEDFRHPTSAIPSQLKDSITDQIKKLSELHSAGMLTNDEFTSKKTELLARL